MDNRSIFTSGNESPRRTTLLALVQGLSRQGHSENEIEHEVLELVESGRVILIGSFRACPLRPSRPEGGGDDRRLGDAPRIESIRTRSGRRRLLTALGPPGPRARRAEPLLRELN